MKRMLEVLDKPLPYEILVNNQGLFKAEFDSAGYVYNFKAQFGRSDLVRDGWEVVFYPIESSRSTHKFEPGDQMGILDSGNVIEVFSTISVIMQTFMLIRQPRKFFFEAEEPSRRKLYDRFADLIVSNYSQYQYTRSKAPWGSTFYFFKDKKFSEAIRVSLGRPFKAWFNYFSKETIEFEAREDHVEYFNDYETAMEDGFIRIYVSASEIDIESAFLDRDIFNTVQLYLMDKVKSELPAIWSVGFDDPQTYHYSNFLSVEKYTDRVRESSKEFKAWFNYKTGKSKEFSIHQDHNSFFPNPMVAAKKGEVRIDCMMGEVAITTLTLNQEIFSAVQYYLMDKIPMGKDAVWAVYDKPGEFYFYRDFLSVNRYTDRQGGNV
jgi:hypothetical protein